MQYRVFKKGTKFYFVIEALRRDRIISAELTKRLHDLRDLRNEIHLFLKDPVEMYEGKPAMYNEAVRVLRTLENALNRHWSDNAP